MSRTLNTEDEVYNYFLDLDVTVNMIGERFYLTRGEYHLILDETGDDDDTVREIVSCNIPYIEDDVEKAALLIMTAIQTLGCREQIIH